MPGVTAGGSDRPVTGPICVQSGSLVGRVKCLALAHVFGAFLTCATTLLRHTTYPGCTCMKPFATRRAGQTSVTSRHQFERGRTKCTASVLHICTGSSGILTGRAPGDAAGLLALSLASVPRTMLSNSHADTYSLRNVS